MREVLTLLGSCHLRCTPLAVAAVLGCPRGQRRSIAVSLAAEVEPATRTHREAALCVEARLVGMTIYVECRHASRTHLLERALHNLPSDPLTLELGMHHDINQERVADVV
jgi:hypothetical protein